MRADEWEDWEDDPVLLGIGSMHTLTEVEKSISDKKIKRRPIGFLANIDEFIEEDD